MNTGSAFQYLRERAFASVRAVNFPYLRSGTFPHLLAGLLVVGLAGHSPGQDRAQEPPENSGVEALPEDTTWADARREVTEKDSVETDAITDSAKVQASQNPELDLTDLGFSRETLSGQNLEPSSQRRTTMLGWHQRLGLATAAAMTATLLAGKDAEVTLLHKSLGITTGLLYYTTAGFSLFAPKPKVEKEQGNIVLHKWLAWIHGTAMIAGPGMGMLAANELENPQSEGGRLSAFAADYHGTVMRVGYFSFITAMFVMVVEF